MTIVIAVVVIAGLAIVLPRVRRERGVRRARGGVLEDPTTTAEVYRARATAALQDGRYAAAVVEAFRAIARSAADRTLLSDAPGQTAHEIGTSLAVSFPLQAMFFFFFFQLLRSVRVA